MAPLSDPSTSLRDVDLTHSYKNVTPQSVLDRYTFLEVRNGAAVLKASNPTHFDELVQVLEGFHVYDADLLIPGGNRGQIATRLDAHFEQLGWQAIRVNTEFKLVGKGKKGGAIILETEAKNDGFEVDNMKGRVAIDVEWNAKDGNLDRDLAAYRSLYDLGLIDAAVLITRDHYSIRDLAGVTLESDTARGRLSTITSTNTIKLKDRLERGDAGGCPVFAVGIGVDTWAGKDVPRPGEEHTTVAELVAAYEAAQEAKKKAKGEKAQLTDDEIDEVVESVTDTPEDPEVD